MKKISLIFLSLFVFILAGFLLLQATRIADAKKQTEVTKLENQLKSVDSEEEKLLLIIKIDTLSPTEDNKIKIADLYLKQGNIIKAENYLKKVKSRQALIIAAQTALETKNEKAADTYLAKLPEGVEKSELKIFRNFSNGDSIRLTELETEPVTELGKLMKAINTDRYENFEILSYLGEKIEIIKKSHFSKIKLRLKIAEMMINNNQPKISRFILEQLEKKNSNLTDLQLIKLKSFEFENNNEEALKIVKKLIAVEPANLSHYQKALGLAQKLNLTSEVEYLQSQITYLQKIKK